MQLTRMPCGASSTARCFVSMPTPALAAAYATLARDGCRPAADDIVTIDPRPRATMPGANAWIVAKTLVRSLVTVWFQSSSDISNVGFGAPAPPANAARTAGGPSSASTSVDQVRERIRVGAVAGDRDGAPAGVPERLAYGLERFGVPADDRDQHAVAGEEPGGRGAEGTGTARDHGDATGQVGEASDHAAAPGPRPPYGRCRPARHRSRRAGRSRSRSLAVARTVALVPAAARSAPARSAPARACRAMPARRRTGARHRTAGPGTGRTAG